MAYSLGTAVAAVKRGPGRGTVSVRCDITTDASGDMTAVTLPAVFGRLVGVGYTPYPRWLPQTNTITVLASGGTFTITRNATTTAAIAANATAATVAAAIAATGFGNPTVTRDGVVNAYVYTLTFDGEDFISLPTSSKGTYAAVTTTATSLTGGANTATVTALYASTEFTALVTGADITIADATTGATILALTNAGTTARFFRPTALVRNNVGASITADTSNNDLNRDIYVAGPLTVTVAQGGNIGKGSLLLTVEES